VTLNNTTRVTCAGGNNGGIDINVTGGVAPYTYSWNTGATTQDITGIPAGGYQVTVSGANNCQSTFNVTLTQPAPLQAQVQSFNTGCGNAIGALKVTASGGVAPYSYLWSTSATTDSIGGLAAGVYSVQIQDSLGCTITRSGAISSNGAPVIVLDSIRNTTCNAQNGAVYVTVSGGVTPYTFSWNNGSTQADLVNVRDSTYALTVTGANNCASTLVAIVGKQVPVTPQICLVTVDSATRNNEIVWEKPSINPGIAFYRIYRESSAANVFIPIGTRHVDSLSSFVDSVASPEAKSWKYRLSAVDSCGVESNLSSVHKTIHLLQGIGVLPNSVNLLWDNYEGINFTQQTYYIYRNTTANFQLIDSIAFQPLFNSRSLFSQPVTDPNLYYIVEALPPGTCTATEAKSYNTTRSNASRAAESGIVAGVVTRKSTGHTFKLYPVPAKEYIETESEEDYRYELMDMLGHVLSRGESQSGKAWITVAGLSQGTYFLKVFHKEGVSVHKVVKQ
jgi:hypothetical protein